MDTSMASKITGMLLEKDNADLLNTQDEAAAVIEG